MKSQDQVSRLLGLVPYLRARPGASVDATASAFGMSKKQLVADLKLLWMCGLPGGMPDDLIDIDMDAVTDDGVIHISNVDYLARPMRLRSDEALGLVVALQSLTEVVSSQVRPTVDSALAKLRGQLGADAVPVEVDVESGEACVRDALLAAIEAGRRVRLTHHGQRRSTQPVVDPARIETVGGYAYLQAWNVEVGQWRSYRLDRIEACDETGQAAQQHGSPPTAGDWFDASGERLTLRLRPGAHWVCEYYPTSEVGREGDDLVATFPMASASWARALVMRLGADAQVVSPAAVAADAADEAHQVLARYAELDQAG